MPVVAVSACPTRIVPVIAGSVVSGRTGPEVVVGVGVGAATTTAVDGLISVAVPTAFVAVSDTEMNLPRSVEVSTYVEPVAPEIVAHPVANVVEDALCAAAHRTHVSDTVGLGVPVQVPGVAVSVEPTRAVPVIVAAEEFAGAVPTAVGAAVKIVEFTPDFDPVTLTVMNLPTWADVGVNVVDVTAGDNTVHEPGIVATGDGIAAVQANHA